MNNPKPEHRLTFLEKQFVAMGGHLEGIQEDIENLEDHVNKGFKQAHAYMQEEIETRLDRIESTMATKDAISQLRNEMKSEMGTMKNEILDAMKQLLQQKSGE